MWYYFIAAGLMAHAYFWGAGAAWLVLPWRWRRWWWAFAPGLGLALQSAVVWAGAHTALPGTGSYAWWSELLPVGLLLAGLSRRGIRSGRQLGASLVRPPVVLLAGIMAVGGWFLLNPMAAAGSGVTSSSLGSCDHADYAMGARVLAEFSQNDRTGMLGLTEVTHIGSAEYFFDFWLRLNHFTPSALIAHNSVIFGLEPYRLVSLTAVVLLLLNVPMVFFLSRVAAGSRTGVALFVAGLYALSPLSAYAVHQGALGQLLAAQGIGLLVVMSALLFREAGGARRLWPSGLVMLAAFWLLAGSYNFILVVCLAQAAPWVLGRAWVRSRFQPVLRVAIATGAAVAACMLLFWPRFSGIVERFQLFADHDYGWAVPLVSWDGWLGLVSDVYLEANPSAWRWLVMLGLAAGWTVWLVMAWRGHRAQALAAAALVLPVAAGWTILAWESLARTNASYDAFKLISVFYPGLLAGLCAGLVLGGKSLRSRCTMIFLALILVFNLTRADEFRRKMAHPPLRVEKHLVALGRIESMAGVASVNVRVSLYWARLWADAFLLRKPHYFAEPTYEGRNVTPLRGEWDLRYTMLRVLPPAESDRIELDPNFQLVRPAAVQAVRAEFGAGWYAVERFGTDQWRWTNGTGQILLTNTQATPLGVGLRLMVEGLRRGDKLEVECNGPQVLAAGLDTVPGWTEPVDLMLPPGKSVLILNPGSLNSHRTANDGRSLGIGLHVLELRLPRGP
jgi:hypothetical protein